MASFTDLIPQFNPYIQQLPVEAMVSVGMEKQKRYDEGLQKIQSQIERVAGLDVYRGVDKSYLESKLNELGNNLKTVAAGDFSNFQLVNSVSGMAGQIVKDPVVQNAVSSTAKLRKELSAMEEFKQKGKSDRNNEEYFMDKVVRPYLEGGLKDEAGNLISFNGSYSPYVNIMELVNDGVKNAGIDTSLIQQMYQTDNQGRLILDKKTGQPIPARTMTEVETSTNAKQIKAVVENVLSRGDVQNQLMIDGWANTRGVSGQSIMNAYKGEYQKKIDDVDVEMLEINTLLTGKLSGAERQALESKLEDYKNLKERYKNQYLSLGALAQTDEEAFKQNYYKTNFENNLLEQFTKYESKQKNLKSPLTEQLNWEADYAFKERKEAFDQRMAVRNIQLAERKAQLDEFKFQAEYEFDQSTGKWSKKPETSGAGTADYRMTADVPGEENRSALQRQESQIRNLQSVNNQTGMDLMYNYLYKLNGGKNNTGGTLTKADVVKSVESWARANNETTDQFLTRWILNLDNKSKESGVKLSASDTEAIGNFKRNHYNYTTLLAIGKVADDEAMKATGINLQDFTKTLNPLNVKLKDGRSTTITKEDVLDYMLLIKNDDKGAEDRIIAKYGSLDNFPLNTYKTSRSLSKAELEERNRLQQFSGMFTIYNKDFGKLKEASKIKNDYLAKVVNTDEVFSFADDDEKAMKAAKNRVSAFLSGASSVTGAGFDKSTALAALADPNTKVSFKASAPFEEGGQWKGTIMITTEKGEVIEADVPVQKDLEQLTGKKFNPYRMNPLKARAMVSKFGSTNLGTFTTDPRAWESSAIGAENFVSMKGSKKYFPLGADLNVLPNGGYTVSAYFKDATTGKVLQPIEFDRIYVSEDQAKADLALLTESMIDKELK